MIHFVESDKSMVEGLDMFHEIVVHDNDTQMFPVFLKPV